MKVYNQLTTSTQLQNEYIESIRKTLSGPVCLDR